MPLRPLGPSAAPSTPAAPTARTSTLRPLPVASEPEETESEFPVGPAVAGGVALAGAALLARNPKAPAVIKKGLEHANALRQQLMLSGFAPVKSLLGNVGATIAESAETRSLKPLKELFSAQTMRDITPTGATVGEKIKNLLFTGRARQGANSAGGVNLPGVVGGPGRVMTTLDDATRKALVRSGMAPEAAEQAVFQSPLGKNYGPAAQIFDNPVMDYLFPFRRTPLNQFAEGGKVLTNAFQGKGDPLVLGGYAATGAAHGAATADEQYPLSIPFGIALAAKYGLPYGVAALAGRALAGGKGAGNTAGSVLPVSEYGLSQSIEEPLAPFTEPAVLRALHKLVGRDRP